MLAIISMLMSSILTSSYILEPDYRDGTIDTLKASLLSGRTIIISKFISSWISTSLPIVITTPVLANILFNISWLYSMQIAIIILLASLTVNSICLLAASITCALRQGELIVGIIVMPLIISLLIFANKALVQGHSSSILIMSGLAIISIPLTVIVSAILLEI